MRTCFTRYSLRKKKKNQASVFDRLINTLLFTPCAQILVSGVHLDLDNNIVLLDQELASMRSGRAFLSQINDGIPRGRSSMGQMSMELQSQRKRPLAQDQFDTLVLSTVYSAHRARRRDRADEDREAWGTLLLQLANVTVHDLRGTHLFNFA